MEKSLLFAVMLIAAVGCIAESETESQKNESTPTLYFSKNYKYNGTFEEALKNLRKKEGWVLESTFVRTKGGLIKKALTLGLSSYYNPESVSYVFIKEGCSEQRCPRYGILVLKTEPPQIYEDCVIYKNAGNEEIHIKTANEIAKKECERFLNKQ